MEEQTDQESQLIEELRSNLSDLVLPKHHLASKNLLRFLRARNHSVQNAETMFRRQIEWREEVDVENLVEWEYPKEFKASWPWLMSGFDDMDGPVIVVPAGLWDASKVAGNYNDFVKYGCQAMECMWQVIQYKGKGQSCHNQFSIIVDLKGLSFRTVTTIDAMQGVLEIVKVFEANYPETLRVGFLINAPYVFEIAWKLIRPLMSEHTHSKLRFLGSDETTWKEELASHIPIDQFPEKYGGSAPDYLDIAITKYGCGQGNKGPRHANSNELLCENFMKI